MLPGPKVGLIIGKNGKTIKQLQEQSGAKMVVIQDGPNTEYVSTNHAIGLPCSILLKIKSFNCNYKSTIILY